MIQAWRQIQKPSRLSTRTFARGGLSSSIRSMHLLRTWANDQCSASLHAYKKDRPDGSTKRRMIMDSKASMVTAASRKMYRAVLPGLTDMISDLLSLIASESPSEVIWQMVLDAEDDYWQVPLHTSEHPLLWHSAPARPPAVVHHIRADGFDTSQHHC